MSTSVVLLGIVGGLIGLPIAYGVYMEIKEALKPVNRPNTIDPDGNRYRDIYDTGVLNIKKPVFLHIDPGIYRNTATYDPSPLLSNGSVSNYRLTLRAGKSRKKTKNRRLFR